MASTDLEERFAREYVVNLDAPAAYRRVRPEDLTAAAMRRARELGAANRRIMDEYAAQHPTYSTVRSHA